MALLAFSREFVFLFCCFCLPCPVPFVSRPRIETSQSKYTVRSSPTVPRVTWGHVRSRSHMTKGKCTYIIISQNISSGFTICIAKLELFHWAVAAVTYINVNFGQFSMDTAISYCYSPGI